MSNTFTIDELNLIRDLVEEEVAKRKNDGDYEIWTYDIELFNSILTKVERAK